MRGESYHSEFCGEGGGGNVPGEIGLAGVGSRELTHLLQGGGVEGEGEVEGGREGGVGYVVVSAPLLV